jgi:hypothetical protein
MSNLNQVIDSVLQESGEISKEAALQEMSLLIALSKRDKYQIECQNFEQKYGMNFSFFENDLHRQKNTEDYEKESDLDDWEFAISSLKWWQMQIEELRNVFN